MTLQEMEEIQKRFNDLRLEMEGLQRELDTANQALNEAMVREAVLREALEKSKELFILGDLYRRYTGQLQPNKAKGFQEKADIIHGEIRKALSSPSPAADRWKAMEKVCETAFRWKREVLAKSDSEEAIDAAVALLNTLSAMEKAGDSNE